MSVRRVPFAAACLLAGLLVACGSSSSGPPADTDTADPEADAPDGDVDAEDGDEDGDVEPVDGDGDDDIDPADPDPIDEEDSVEEDDDPVETDEDDGDPVDADEEPFTVEVTPEGGQFDFTNGVRLVFPAGAVNATIRVSVTHASVRPPEGVVALGSIFRFEPEGTRFSLPVRAWLPVLIGARRDADTGAVYWTREGSSDQFDRLDSTADGARFVADVWHFSLGFAGAEMGDPDEEWECLPAGLPRCDGTVLMRCVEGRWARDDCAEVGQECYVDPQVGGLCRIPPGDPDPVDGDDVEPEPDVIEPEEDGLVCTPRPANATCVDVPPSGLCAGSWLRRCDQGTGSVVDVDCCETGRQCVEQAGGATCQAPGGGDPDEEEPDADPCEGMPVGGRCVGTWLERCTNGSLQTFDCAVLDGRCIIDPFERAVCELPDDEDIEGIDDGEDEPEDEMEPEPDVDDPCAALPPEGVCHGDVWHVCFSSMYLEQDCSVAGYICEMDVAGGRVGCVQPQGPCGTLSDRGRCVGERREWCDNGTTRRVECPDFGRICLLDDLGRAVCAGSGDDCGRLPEGGRCAGDVAATCSPSGLVLEACGLVGRRCATTPGVACIEHPQGEGDCASPMVVNLAEVTDWPAQASGFTQGRLPSLPAMACDSRASVAPDRVFRVFLPPGQRFTLEVVPASIGFDPVLLYGLGFTCAGGFDCAAIDEVGPDAPEILPVEGPANGWVIVAVIGADGPGYFTLAIRPGWGEDDGGDTDTDLEDDESEAPEDEEGDTDVTEQSETVVPQVPPALVPAPDGRCAAPLPLVASGDLLVRPGTFAPPGLPACREVGPAAVVAVRLAADTEWTVLAEPAPGGEVRLYRLGEGCADACAAVPADASGIVLDTLEPATAERIVRYAVAGRGVVRVQADALFGAQPGECDAARWAGPVPVDATLSMDATIPALGACGTAFTEMPGVAVDVDFPTAGTYTIRAETEAGSPADLLLAAVPFCFNAFYCVPATDAPAGEAEELIVDATAPGRFGIVVLSKGAPTSFRLTVVRSGGAIEAPESLPDPLFGGACGAPDGLPPNGDVVVDLARRPMLASLGGCDQGSLAPVGPEYTTRFLLDTDGIVRVVAEPLRDDLDVALAISFGSCAHPRTCEVHDARPAGVAEDALVINAFGARLPVDVTVRAHGASTFARPPSIPVRIRVRTDACGGESVAGRCDGDRRVWCEDGAIRSAACADGCREDGAGGACVAPVIPSSGASCEAPVVLDGTGARSAPFVLAGMPDRFRYANPLRGCTPSLWGNGPDRVFAIDLPDGSPYLVSVVRRSGNGNPRLYLAEQCGAAMTAGCRAVSERAFFAGHAVDLTVAIEGGGRAIVAVNDPLGSEGEYELRVGPHPCGGRFAGERWCEGTSLVRCTEHGARVVDPCGGGACGTTPDGPACRSSDPCIGTFAGFAVCLAPDSLTVCDDLGRPQVIACSGDAAFSRCRGAGGLARCVASAGCPLEEGPGCRLDGTLAACLGPAAHLVDCAQSESTRRCVDGAAPTCE